MQKLLSRVPSERSLQVGLLVVYVALRLAALWHFRADLSGDPDVYLAIARNVAAGHGIAEPASRLPTAFRPPLYPLLLAPVSGPDQQFQRGLLNLGLSLITFLAIWRAGNNLGLNPWQTLLANLIYTFDPLAVRYLAFPMTETLCACLVSLLIVLLTESRSGPVISFITGITFGLCVLSRPTFWIFGILYAPIWLIIHCFHPSRAASAPGAISVQSSHLFSSRSRILLQGILAVLGVAFLVVPWVLRNEKVLHAPIVMTTHGGYTLLLGNNEAFYREVVDQPWGTIWDESHGGGQQAWIEKTTQAAIAAGISGEVEKDRWMSQQAWQAIRSQPGMFARACLLKFCWFWNIGPQGPEAHHMSPLILWSVRLFYLLFWAAALLGLGRITKRLCFDFHQQWRWLVPVLLAVSLSGAHLIYWSDARMRAPITPALVLIAACAWPIFKRFPSN